jgi:hypothetical protein
MPINRCPFIKLNVLVILGLAGCAPTRQVAVDYPTAESSDANAQQTTKSHPFQALPNFSIIDGDDYYVRLVSEFETKGENALKKGCESLAPSFKKNDLSSALIFNVRNSRLKFNNDVAGYSYQASTGNCNYKFDAKKLNLTPWMRLDLGRETLVDYSVLSSANSDVDVASVVNKVTAASSLLAFTGVGMGVAVIGQFAGQWYKNTQQASAPTSIPAANNSTESHSLPPFVKYANNSGTLSETVFKVYVVAEGGMNILSSETKPYGELRLYPELTASLLFKTKADGLPDASDLSFSEISYTPVKSATGEINLQKLIEQSQHPDKPNLKPDWNNYDDVQSNCRKLKLVMKDLGFNKFDRNAYLYYFLINNNDWKNYNISAQKVQNEEISTNTLQKYRSNNFGNCLATDDYVVMKALGLPVNTGSDWAQMGDTSQKKEQFFAPLKAIERQLVAVLKNPNKSEMENQIYPLIATATKGEGTVLLQNRLGEFGLEKLLQPEAAAVTPTTTSSLTVAASTPIATPSPIPTISPIPGEGLVIGAHQLIQVFSGMAINELSCARIIPEQLGKQAANTGIMLFTTQPGSLRAKGGAMELEYANGKINRIAFQSPTYRDFEQNVLDHPELGGCRIDPAFFTKLR